MSAAFTAAVAGAVLAAALTVAAAAALPPSRAERLRHRLAPLATPSAPSRRLPAIRRCVVPTLLASGTVVAVIAVGPVAGLAVASLGLAAMAVAPRRAASQRRREFRASLPDAIALLCGALGSGLAVAPAIETVSREAGGVVGDEWSRAVAESRLGRTLDEALGACATRMSCPELAWLVEVLAINREVGGDLSSVLGTVAATLRDRERHRRRVRALTAEARLSAIVLCCLPPAFAGYLAIARPDYLAVLTTTPTGWAMVATALGLLLIGVFWMRLLVHAQEDS